MPGSGRSPSGGHANPLQYSCLENPMDRGAWWAMVHRTAESDMTKTTQHAPKLAVGPAVMSKKSQGQDEEHGGDWR